MSYDVLSPAVARLWPYSPNWSGGFTVRRAWKTDICTARDKTEQRRALRQVPRLSVDYRTTQTAADLTAAKLWLRAWQNKPAVIPHFARYALTTAPSLTGAFTLDVSPLPAWIAIGQRVVLCGVGVTEEGIVATAVGTTITLADPLANDWPSGSVLRPTFFGLLDGELQTNRITPGAGEISVSLDALPGGEPPAAAGTAWATLGAREIFTLDPDYRSPVNVRALFAVEKVDVGRGRTGQFRPFDRAEQIVEADFSALGSTAALELEQFFDRMKGKRNAFYLPSGEKDLDLAASAGSGSTTFLVTGTALADDFGAVDYSLLEQGVAIFLTNGTRIYRRVNDIALSGGDSLVTLSAALGTAITTANVARISWMPLVRFGSDEMAMTWQTPLSAGSRLPFQSVRR